MREVNLEQEAVAMLEESPSGDEAADGVDANINRNCNVVLRVRSLHISSPILAAKSSFFYKLFSKACHPEDHCIRFQEEVFGLPLTGVEAILSSDDLQVASENAVYDFLLKWARIQYPKLEERREVLATRLARLIRFPYMSCRKLKKVLTCNDFDHEVAAKLVLEATFFKAEAPHRQWVLAAESASSGRSFMERAYKYRPL